MDMSSVDVAAGSLGDLLSEKCAGNLGLSVVWQ